MADPQSISGVLGRAADLCEQGWCQGVAAVSAGSHSVEYNSPVASRWCASGAIRLAAKSDKIWCDVVVWFEDLMHIQFIANWNDSHCRTQSEVVSALRSASAKAREGE